MMFEENNEIKPETMYGMFKTHDRLKRPLLESEIKKIQTMANNVRDAARMLGVSVDTFIRYSKKYNLYEEFKNRSKVKKNLIHQKKSSPRIPIEELLKGKHLNYPMTLFRERLIEEGYKKRVCECCGFSDTRNDGKCPLVIIFMDGNKNNWDISNIKFICYNCSFLIQGYDFEEELKMKNKGKYIKSKSYSEIPTKGFMVNLNPVSQQSLIKSENLIGDITEKEMEEIRKEFSTNFEQE